MASQQKKIGRRAQDLDGNVGNDEKKSVSEMEDVHVQQVDHLEN